MQGRIRLQRKVIRFERPPIEDALKWKHCELKMGFYVRGKTFAIKLYFTCSPMLSSDKEKKFGSEYLKENSTKWKI